MPVQYQTNCTAGGSIDPAELRDELDKIPEDHQNHGLEEKMVDDLMREADVDHDGSIEVLEWVKLMLDESDDSGSDEEDELENIPGI
eukprot:SAG11_NODE_136_length_15118_cov_14.188495_12_plen_87_part_00